MSLQRRFISGDEELGKKDDDHRHRGLPSAMATPSAYTLTWRGPRRKRSLLALAVLSILYIFFKNMPTDAFTATQRAASRHPFSEPSRKAATSPRGPPPRSEDSVDVKHHFAGPIMFYDLASSLGAGQAPVYDNRNVLFVASSLKSAASLLPLACDMARVNKNRVHVMLAGRDDLAIKDIERINGITGAECPFRWHDGRPDFSAYSTDSRMEVSVQLGLGHIAGAMKLGVVMIDHAEREDGFLARGMREKTKSLGLHLVELPHDAAEKVKWISKLDVSSLKSWNDVNIEILIHSPPESSGSLIRLLKSLESADYFGFPYPHLTIELPDTIDPPASQYLSTFRWPPRSRLGDSRLTLRHRLSSVQVDATQASIRQIESFYPANVPNSNILVLSPQVELSSLYFQYLVYNLLEYKHSKTALTTSANLVGISLEKPATTLDNQGAFSPPETSSAQPFFLYQSPNSNAALYFGDKWVELHSFFSNRLAVSRANAVESKTDAIIYEPAKTYPAWLGFILELCRSRGYTMLYPSLRSPHTSLATIHRELYQPPEEFSQRNSSDDSPSSSTNDSPPSSSSSSNPEDPIPDLPASLSLLSVLFPPTDSTSSSNSEAPAQALPDLSTLALLSHTGAHLAEGQAALDESATRYADAFASQYGGCDESLGRVKRGEKRPWSADDLFCSVP